MPLVTQSIPMIKADISPGNSAHLHDRASTSGVLTSVSDSEHPHSPPVGNLFALDQRCHCIQLQLHIALSLNISECFSEIIWETNVFALLILLAQVYTSVGLWMHRLWECDKARSAVW